MFQILNIQHFHESKYCLKSQTKALSYATFIKEYTVFNAAELILLLEINTFIQI